MDQKVITEIVTFEIKDSISIETFTEIVTSLEMEFHMIPNVISN